MIGCCCGHPLRLCIVYGYALGRQPDHCTLVLCCVVCVAVACVLRISACSTHVAIAMHRMLTVRLGEHIRPLEVTAPDGETVTMALAESANMGEVKGEIEKQTGKAKRNILLFLTDATPAFETLIGGANRALPNHITVAKAMQGASKQEEEEGQATRAAPLQLYMTIGESAGHPPPPPPRPQCYL